jgi:hypothetical protein
MLEIILIITLIFLILTFFYKQAVCEFRMNQIEWSQKENISDVKAERIPFVIRGIPKTNVWSYNDVMERTCFKEIPIFQEVSLTDWINQSNVESICPWKYSQAELIANTSAISIWANQWLNSIMIPMVLKYWIYAKYHCWAGNIGLRRMYPMWTCIIPIDGEIMVSIMPETSESFLPKNWIGCFPNQLTNKDTPFVNDIKFIDIILRPGNCLFMPPHWFVSWSSSEKNTILPMVCTISYHTPISLFAFHMTPFK